MLLTTKIEISNAFGEKSATAKKLQAARQPLDVLSSKCKFDLNGHECGSSKLPRLCAPFAKSAKGGGKKVCRI
jgi:hypothetical protein